MNYSKIFRLAIFLLVLAFTFVLRAHNYDRIPTANHLDEMLYAWSGLYLIETGIPVSWSTLEYPTRAEVFRGRITYKGDIPDAYVTLYKPWLDQPPVFSLLVGTFAHLYGANREEFVPSSYIRMPVVIISTLTSMMIFLVGRVVSGYWIGILAMLIFGTTPLMVFASRTAMPENLIALFLTVMVYLLIKFSDKHKLLYLIPIPFLAGIAGLSKSTGYFLLPLALYFVFASAYGIKSVKWILKVCLSLIVVTIPFIAAFFLYGMYYDPEIFWRITQIQSSRPAGFNSLAFFFTSPAFRTVTLIDGWYVFCLLSAAFFLFAPKAGLKRIISLTFVYWLAIVIISSGENDLLPWYRFPAFPMLAILGAWGMQLITKRADFFATFLTVGLLLGNRTQLVNAFRPNITPGNFRIIFSLLMLPSLLQSVFQKGWLENLNRILIIGVIIVGIYINTIAIYNAFEIFCQSKVCPLVPNTALSSVYFPIIWRFFVLDK